MVEPRGVRNRNPGNIKISSSPWLGKVPEDQNTDGIFEQFKDEKYGIRAIAVILRNYHQLHGLQTLRDYIGRWAPSSENNTDAYLSTISDMLRYNADQPYDVTNSGMLAALVAAIISQENGEQPYQQDTLNEGVQLA